MAFLNTVADTPGISFSWSQSMKDDKIEIKLFLHNVPETASLKNDISVKMTGDGETLVVEHHGKKIVYWKLFNEVKEDDLGDNKIVLEAEMKKDTKPMHILIPLEKKKSEQWQSLRSQPVVASEAPDAMFCSDDTLQKYIEMELPKLPAFNPDGSEVVAAEGGADAAAVEAAPAAAGEAQDDKKKEVVDPDDLDALLDEAADELKPSVTQVVGAHEDEKKEEGGGEGSQHSVMTGSILAAKRDEELRSVKAEYETLHEAETKFIATLAETEGKEDSSESDKKAEELAKEQIERVRVLKALLKEKATIRSQHPSVANLISVVKLDMCRAMLGNKLVGGGIAVSNLDVEAVALGGGEDFNIEKEDFVGDEAQLSKEEVFARGSACLQIQSPESLKDAFHWLRLAALRHNNPVAAVMLHSMYSNMKAPTHGAYFLLRRALQKDAEVHTNRLVGELVASGAQPFFPAFSMALFFLQRAARQGDVQALLSLSHLFFNGTCRSTRAVLGQDVRSKFRDITRGKMQLQAALDRGCPDAYFAKAGMHLDGEWEHEKDAALAQKYFELLKATDQTLASRVGRMFEIAARQGGANRPFRSNKDDDEPSAPELPGSSSSGNKSAFTRQTTSSSDKTSGLSIVPRPGQQQASGGAAATASKRLAAMNARSSGNEGEGGSVAGRSATGGKAGGVARAMNPWQGRFETAARWGAGVYAVYMVAFPVRLMLLPYFYEAVDNFMGRFFGVGRSRSTRGGMLM